MSPLDNGNRWSTLSVTLFALGCLALMSGRSPAWALVNESPSLPRGLYVRISGAPARGATVATPPPASARPYLASLGASDDQLLLKRVAAVSGDRVCRKGDHVETPMGRVIVSRADRNGVGLSFWRGCRRLEPHEVFLLGDTPNSFDSRYFGPVDRSLIRGVYREAASW
ncbi:S26 family signal peptidase [Brevundimonas sp. NPDC090276]|uniref:S26 family signal peptidase n=1 Tax=Brevundimonas sp. NPDC090276 TaxID=3363956 RepID=UPI00383B0660